MNTSGDNHQHIDEHFSPEATGLELIREERLRQVQDEGFDATRDDSYTRDELALAAVCYATPPSERTDVDGRVLAGNWPPDFWPWSSKGWKPSLDASPKGRILELVKAGALITAEIDRLQRLRARTEG